MKWMITGAGGMVGSDLGRALVNEDVVTVAHADLDITDRAGVIERVKDFRPDVVINCAAYTKVDDCESNEDLAMAVNGRAVGYLAEASNEVDALLIQLSTDFVFDGARRSPYEPADVTAPISVYGRSKLAGEREAAKAAKHCILRTSWLFGRNGWNFVEAICKQIESGRSQLDVVSDQRGRPTYTPHLARAILLIARKAVESDKARGIVHYADDPECSWFDFSVAIVHELERSRRLNHSVEVRPITTEEMKRPATRPAYSVLSTRRYERLGGKPESWLEGLREYFRKD